MEFAVGALNDQNSDEPPVPVVNFLRTYLGTSRPIALDYPGQK